MHLCPVLQNTIPPCVTSFMNVPLEVYLHCSVSLCEINLFIVQNICLYFFRFFAKCWNLNKYRTYISNLQVILGNGSAGNKGFNQFSANNSTPTSLFEKYLIFGHYSGSNSGLISDSTLSRISFYT